MSGLLSLHDLRQAPYGAPPVEYLSLVHQYDLDRAAYLLWLNDPGSADEWPYREPVDWDDPLEEYPDNDDQLP